MSVAADSEINPRDPHHTDQNRGPGRGDDCGDANDHNSSNDGGADRAGGEANNDCEYVLYPMFNPFLLAAMQRPYRPEGLPNLPNPIKDASWSALCRDDRWKYISEDESLRHCRVLDSERTDDYWPIIGR